MVIRKTRKMGDVLNEQSISVRRPVLITGTHAAGKSRWLKRLYADAHRVWATRAKATPLYLVASNSLAEWVDGKHLELWWAGRAHGQAETRHWSKLKPFEKYRALPLYLQETGAVLFIDDAHAMTTNSKKGKVAQDCVRAAGVWVIAATDEGRLFPGLRKDVMGLDPQIFRLESDVAMDNTKYLIWSLAAFFMVIGLPGAAFAIAGAKVLVDSRKAAKQS
ncbi:hypothetical protein [Methylomagnum ishizawai]|uniref:hypothetical protein n=1 Tax=Methylomagnum ishizawai TaxID=1760988 RepID=UPI001C7F2315|nr:hypothetical protein [Methylomagnum ishizawai]